MLDGVVAVTGETAAAAGSTAGSEDVPGMNNTTLPDSRSNGFGPQPPFFWSTTRIFSKSRCSRVCLNPGLNNSKKSLTRPSVGVWAQGSTSRASSSGPMPISTSPTATVN